MSTRMLIDARHPEETRVAVVKGNQVEDFDYESVARHYHKGNIYLAKVTRVEPSLQACFVDYGENRHGFLAFSEIHPDYYQIPAEDREALLAEEAGHHASESGQSRSGNDQGPQEAKSADGDENGESEDDGDDDESGVEHISGEDDYDEVSSRKSSHLRRRYKIQEVIKRRQILLIQVVKEERGTKGAALTTYISLAGRYCVLMPNSQNGGGISRKISNVADRKKLKDVMSALQVPDGMGCIIRTAGLNRTKTEIKRDYDYLLRLWDGIRDRTLSSIAPALIHEEADLIKRSIRDLYSREIDEIHVEGEDGYKAAKSFMKLLMPSHARRVQHYKDRIPLFYRYQVENQLDAMYSPTVQLKSGGYLVINPTEALIAIDVNSGRSTKEHNIEETALKTNLEAADEVARQLRLRDLAGLVVIDFIDMEDRGNNRAVEKRLKEALKSDRARIQVGRISSFGLMEMSRQRLRPNLLEATRLPCPHCSGAGIVPSKESAALNILRALEEEGIRDRSSEVTIKAPAYVAFYLLNQKRAVISELEQRYAFKVKVEPGENMGATPFEMDRVTKTAEQRASEGRDEASQIASDPDAARASDNNTADTHEQDAAAQDDTQDDDNRKSAAQEGDTEDGQPPKKRRRRRRRGRRGRGGDDQNQTSGDQVAAGSDNETGADAGATSPAPNDKAETTEDQSADTQSEPRAEARGTTDSEAETGTDDQRPRRRSRRRRPARSQTAAEQDTAVDVASSPQPDIPDNASATETAGNAPQRRRRVRRKSARPENDGVTGQGMSGQSGEDASDVKSHAGEDNRDDDAKKPARPRRRRRPASDNRSASTNEDNAGPGGQTGADAAGNKSHAPTSVDKAANDGHADTDVNAGTARPAVSESSASVTAPANTDSVERHVIAPDTGAAASGAGTADKTSDKSKAEPRKRGWWQRALGR